MESWSTLAAIAAAFFFAGAIKGVIGLGLPTVAVGLLGLVMPPAQAAAILIVPSLVTNVWQAAAGGSALELSRRMWTLLVGICIGTIFGAIWLAHTDGRGAAMWLGIALVIYALLGLLNVHFAVPRQSEGWLGLIIGLTTGAVTVATGVFVLPGVPYLHALKLDRDRLVQALGLSFTVSTVTLAAALFYAGEMRTSLAVPVVVALIAAPIGMVLGQFVRWRVRPETFRKFFFFSLLALGLHLALRGLL